MKSVLEPPAKASRKKLGVREGENVEHPGVVIRWVPGHFIESDEMALYFWVSAACERSEAAAVSWLPLSALDEISFSWGDIGKKPSDVLWLMLFNVFLFVFAMLNW